MDLKRQIMKELENIRDIEQVERLENEYDFQKALLLDKKLRLMVKEQPGLRPLRKKLRRLMTEYEERVWSDPEQVSDKQLEDSDKAENIVETERRFIKKRKDAIRKKLKEYDMTQQDLGVLLGHSKSYMSELINGVSQFSMRDLVIIHRIFGISLKTLIPTYLQSDTRNRIKKSISRLNKPKLKLKKNDLVNE
jgi:transcriptional regulator with XRE-family HTH domain